MEGLQCLCQAVWLQQSSCHLRVPCRSNGFEQQRFARIANKKAVQELAYKWSVEDM